MNRGGKALLLLGGLGLAACGASSELTIRPITDAGAKLRQGGADLAAARAQLALGNAGLALEAFRIIQRNRPTDPAPLAGIADCYAAMGRFDLAESNFEEALALAPHDPTLLLGLAGILEREGDHVRALAVRAEANQAQAAAAPIAALVQTAPVPTSHEILSPNYAGSVTVALPPARPADRLSTNAEHAGAKLAQAAVTPAMEVAGPAAAPQLRQANEQSDAQPVQPASALPLRSSITVALPQAREARLAMNADRARTQLAHAAETDPIVWTGPAAVAVRVQPDQRSSTTPLRAPLAVALPTARAADQLSTDRTQLVQAAATAPLAATMPPPPAQPAAPGDPLERMKIPAVLPEATGPRIERLSRGEVMLVTTGRPLWQSKIAPRTLASTTVRWIPLGNAAVRPNVQVVNAARWQGLARSARSVLLDRGWRRIAVGDAIDVRRRSIVFYPRNQAALGRSLAAQFGIKAQVSNGDHLMLVLGRDAVELVRSQRQS